MEVLGCGRCWAHQVLFDGQNEEWGYKPQVPKGSSMAMTLLNLLLYRGGIREYRPGWVNPEGILEPLRLEKAPKCPTCDKTLILSPDHSTERHILLVFGHLQGWEHHHRVGQLLPMPDNFLQ